MLKRATAALAGLLPLLFALVGNQPITNTPHWGYNVTNTRAFAATLCALTSGATQSTIASALSAASTASSSCTGTASPNLVTLAGGTYGPITSTTTIPCGANITGPVVAYSQTPNQAATIQGSSSFAGWGFQTTAGCPQVAGQNQYIKYIEWNGEQPTNGGGGLRIVSGTTNLDIMYNWWHGNQYQGPTAAGNFFQASLVYFDGGSSGAVSSNVNIKWNIFGSNSFGDCSAAMTTSDSQENPYGGLCNGVGMHNNVANITITNNIFHWQEQGMKFYEGQGGSNPVNVSYNDYSHISRIMYETQSNIGTSSQPTNMTIDYNSWHDRYPQAVVQTYMISAANGCGNAYSDNCITHTDYNVYVANVSAGHDVGIEVWGTCDSTGTPCTSASYNLIQGYNYNGITWSRAGAFQLNNNIFQMNSIGGSSNTSCAAHAGGYWNWDGTSGGAPTYAPTCTGNTFGTVPTALTSVQPSYSMAGGTVSSGTVISINNPYSNPRDANTSAWCTTDTTTPVPGSGTAQIMTRYTVTASVTLKCVGMWGAANQPYSYPTGYGYVPSAVISAAYMVSGTPTAATPVLTPGTSSFATSVSVSIADSTTGAIIYYTLDGTTPTTASNVYSVPLNITATTTVNALAVASGYLNSAVGTATYTRTSSSPTITSGYQGNAGNGLAGCGASCNTLTVGETGVQQVAYGVYSDSATRPLPDAYGNSVAWGSSNTAILAVSSTGIVTCIATGTANSVATLVPTQTAHINGWTWTCNAAPPAAATPAFSPASESFTGTVSVTISSATGGAAIYYTTDGSTPTTSSTVYSAPLSISTNTTVNAIATASGYSTSAVGTATYTLAGVTITSVTITPATATTMVGGTVAYTATVLYSDSVSYQSTTVGVANPRGDSISSWVSSTPATASISSGGILTGVALGSTTVQVYLDSGSVHGTAVPATVAATSGDVYTGGTFTGGTWR